MNNSGNPEVVLSAKCYDQTSVTTGKIQQWTKDFTDHLTGHWKNDPIRIFVLAVTHHGQSDGFSTVLKEEKARFKKLGIELRFWFTPKLHDLCSNDKDLVGQYFNLAWVAALFSQLDLQLTDNRASSALSGVGQDRSTLSEAEIADLKSGYNTSVRQLLEVHIDTRRNGNSTDLKLYLAKIKSDVAVWKKLDSDVRAKALRQLVSIQIDDGKLELAKRYLSEAESEAHLPDQVLPALIAYYECGRENALKMLAKANAPAEIELKIALLIEDEQFQAASALLKEADQTAETMRLQAVLELKDGDVEAALVLADRSRELKPEGFGSTLIAIQARFSAALAPNAKVKVGIVTNPFNPALIQQTNEAQDHIRAALNLAERLIERCEGEQKTDAESWRLALLAASVDRRQDTYDYATELSARVKPDPLHVAWAYMIGAPLQLGQVRKRLRDTIVADEGTSAHVVALALLHNDNNKDPAGAAALIERYAERFPKDKVFLDQWIEQFSDPRRGWLEATASGDADAGANLLQMLPTNGSSSADPEAVIGTAETLFDGELWSQLDSMRDVLTAIPVPRAAHLAAMAAHNNYQFDDCAEIIDHSKKLFPNKQLPIYLTALRANALEHAGRMPEALDVLKANDQLAPAPENKRRIVTGLMRLGQQEEAARHARELAVAPEAKADDLLLAAEINKNINPHFARDVFHRLVQAVDLQIGAVPHLLDLEQRLSISSEGLKKDRFYELTGQFFSSAHVLKLDTVEDLLAQVEKISHEKKQLRELWLAGANMSHLAFSADHQSFVHLMWSDFRGFASETDEHYFPLLSTAGLPSTERLAAAEGKTDLALDLSGMLTAARHEILEAIDQSFKIRVPSITQQFLDQAIQNWRFPSSKDDLEKLQKLQRDQWRPLEIDTGTGQDAEEFQRYYAKDSYPADLAAILDPLFSSGLVSTQQQERLLQQLGLDKWPPVELSEKIPEYATLSGGLLFALSSAGCVKPLAKHTTLRIKRSTIAELAKHISKTEENLRQFEQLKALQTFVTRKMTEGSWSMLPTQPRPDMSQEELDTYPDRNALLASFWETFNYSRRDDNPLVWIEDRHIGRYNLPHILNCDDVLQCLVSRNALSAEQAADIRAKKEIDGVGFQPIDAQKIISDLITAAGNAGEFFETPALTQHRLVFARQSALVRFVDWSENRRDQDDLPVGELKHAKNVSFSVAKMLRAIWFNSDLSPEQCITASSWLWQYFQVDSIRADDQTGFTVEQALNMTGALMMDCATQPFFNAFQSGQRGQEHYKPYLNWLFGTHLMPRFHADPELRRVFVEQVASLFGSQFERELGNDDEEKALIIKLSKRETGRLLNLFPTDLREAILDHGDFGEQLGITRDLVINSPAGSFSAIDITERLALLIKTGDESMPISSTNAKNETVFNIVLDQNEDGNTEVSISGPMQTIKLGAYAAMLVHPSPTERLRLFDLLPDTKAQGPEWAQKACEIIGLDETSEVRMTKWNALRKLSFVDTLAEASEELEDDRRLRRDLFDLPTAASLLRYAQLNPTLGTPQEAMTDAVEKLSTVVDKVAARRRLASIAALGDLYELLPPLDQGTEPHVLLTLLESANTLERAEDALGELRKDVDYYLSIFVPLVRDAGQQMLIHEEYKKLPTWARIMLAWVWADSITQILIRCDVDADKFNETLDSFKQQRIDQLLHCDGVPDAYFECCIELKSSWWRYRLFEQLVNRTGGALSLEKNEALISLVGVVEEKSFTPNAAFLLPEIQGEWPLSESDTLSSLIHEKRLEVAPHFSEVGRHEFGSMIIASFDDEKNNPGMLELFSLTLASAIPPEQKIEILAKVEHFFAHATPEDIGKTNMPLLRIYAELCGHMGATEQFEALLEKLIYRRYSDGHLPEIQLTLGTLDTDNLFEHVADAIFAHARACEISLNEKIEQLAKHLEQLYLMWPRAGKAIHQLLISMVSRLPIAYSRALWPVIKRMRTTIDDDED